MLFVVPLTFCIDVVFKFSWGDCKSHRGKLKTMLIQNCGGTTKTGIMIFLKKKPILKADITDPFIVSNFLYKAKALQFFSL